MPDPVSDWMVERLAAGDLPADDARRVRAELEARGELGRLDAVLSANRTFLEAHPPARVVAEIERRGGPRRRPWLLVVPVLAAAAVMVALVVPRSSAPIVVAEGSDVVRLKGQQPYLAAYRKGDEGADRLRDGARVHAGETVQVAYVAAGQRFGVVASIDARGNVTLHLPEQPGAAYELVASGETPVPHAFVLDDTPGFERFVFVTSAHPFASADVVDALHGDKPLPPNLSLTDLTLEKEIP